MSTELDPLGGEPAAVRIAHDSGWKARVLDWIFAQGSIAVVLIAWLGWTIYDGTVKEKARVQAAAAREEWEQKLWSKIDTRLSEITDSHVKAIEKIIAANERKTERDEIRFDKIVDRIKGQ